jgi:hypothetical protein
MYTTRQGQPINSCKKDRYSDHEVSVLEGIAIEFKGSVLQVVVFFIEREDVCLLLVVSLSLDSHGRENL